MTADQQTSLQKLSVRSTKDTPPLQKIFPFLKGGYSKTFRHPTFEGGVSLGIFFKPHILPTSNKKYFS